MHPLMMDLLPLVRQGYCCSQLLLQLLVQAQGREVPDLVRALHGLCHGIGQSGGPCGLLTGGACVLALLAGKGAEGEEPHPMLVPLLNEYAGWFYERTAAYGGHSCEQVALGLGARTAESAEPDPVACGDLLAECWEKILELIQTYDLDFMAHA